MAAINNFGLVGVGSSIKLGKGGITLGQSSGKLTINSGSGATNVAFESYVDDSITGLNLGTMAQANTADYTTTGNLETYLSSTLSDPFLQNSAIGTTVQAYSGTLDTYASGSAPSSYFLTLVTVGDEAALKAAINLEIGTDVQAHSGNLDDIAAGTYTSAGLLATDGAGTWTVDTNTYLTSADLSSYLKADGSVAMTGNLNLNSHKITGLTAGSATGDAVEYDQLNTALSDYTTTASLASYGLDIAGSDLATDVEAAGFVTSTDIANTYLSKSGGTMTGTLTLAGAPSGTNDAATKGYVDGVAAGLSFKESVSAATTANIADLATGAPNTVDGVTLTVGMRILVKSQTTATQNGIYVVDAVGTGSDGVWSRATDADDNSELTGGTFVFVTGGSSYDDTGWVITAPNGSVTIGTDNITWTQYSSTGSVSLAGTAGQISVGTSPAYTISLVDTAVTPGSYGDGATVATFTVDQQGRLTAADEIAIAITAGQVSGLADVATSGDAVDVAFTSAGGIAATNVQAAIEELDTEKQAANANLDTISAATLDSYSVGLLDNASAADWKTDLGYIGDVVDDTTPQLGGDLDVNGNSIVSTSNGNITLAPNGTGSVDVSSKKIINVATPTAGSDGANKQYVDDTVSSAISGGTAGLVKTASASATYSSVTSPIVGTIVTSLANGSTLRRVVIKVTTAWNDAAPTLAILHNGTTYVAAADSDLTATGTYIVDVYSNVSGTANLTYSITNNTATVTTGAVTMMVEYSL